MSLHGFNTRCPVCFFRLFVADGDYGDYNKMVMRDGKMVRKTEDRWFDADWIIQHHISKDH